MTLISDAIFYFTVGMILGIILLLFGTNLLILIALIFGRQGQARRLQHFLDKLTWLRLGGGMSSSEFIIINQNNITIYLVGLFANTAVEITAALRQSLALNGACPSTTTGADAPMYNAETTVEAPIKTGNGPATKIANATLITT